MAYNIETGEVIWLETETVLINKRVRCSDDVPASFTQSVMLVNFRFGVPRPTVEGMRRAYDKYRGTKNNLDLSEVL